MFVLRNIRRSPRCSWQPNATNPHIATSYFSSQNRQRAKRQRLTSHKNEHVRNEKEDDVWTWIGNNAPKWSSTLMQWNLRLLAGSIFAAQTYTIYEWFRFGQIRWHKRVFWWVPNYIPSWINEWMYDHLGSK